MAAHQRKIPPTLLLHRTTDKQNHQMDLSIFRKFKIEKLEIFKSNKFLNRPYHITLSCEQIFVHGLWACPPNWQFFIASCSVIVLVRPLSCKTKIRDFNHQIRIKPVKKFVGCQLSTINCKTEVRFNEPNIMHLHTISSSKIAVDKIHFRKVLHSFCNSKTESQ